MQYSENENGLHSLIAIVTNTERKKKFKYIKNIRKDLMKNFDAATIKFCVLMHCTTYFCNSIILLLFNTHILRYFVSQRIGCKI